MEARISGGTAFRFSVEAGLLQGYFVGEMVNALPFKKL
jgi:hypothetical protein